MGAASACDGFLCHSYTDSLCRCCCRCRCHCRYRCRYRCHCPCCCRLTLHPNAVCELSEPLSRLLSPLLAAGDCAAALVEAAACCAEGLAGSPHNAELVLAQAGLLGLLGAGLAAAEAWRPLEVKHIQLDTISHHILAPLLGAGLDAEAASVLRAVQKLHSDHSRDAGETILLAFQVGRPSMHHVPRCAPLAASSCCGNPDAPGQPIHPG